jgi:hypothetical protein
LNDDSEELKVDVKFNSSSSGLEEENDFSDPSFRTDNMNFGRIQQAMRTEQFSYTGGSSYSSFESGEQSFNDQK